MAFTNFYIQPTGSDVNSGSTTDNVALLSYTGGAWVNATNIFTPVTANPITDGITVGDWISLYPDGGTVTPYIAQVTVRDATTITLSATAKFGTAPIDGAANRSLKRGGAIASMAIFASGSAFQTGTVPVATKINIKAGTYASTTSTRTMALTGTTLLPLWYCGYKTTPSDLDNVKPTTQRVPGTDIPNITFTTGQVLLSGNFVTETNLSFESQSTTTGGTHSNTGACNQADRCRFVNTSANVASVGGRDNGNSARRYTGCYFSANALANCFTGATASKFVGCVFSGGLNGISVVSVQTDIIDCIFINQAASCILAVSDFIAIGNTFYSPAANGINMSTANNFAQVIANNIFVDCTTAGINNTSGANVACVVRINNSYYLTSTKELGFGDHPAFNEIDEIADPFVASPTNFALVSGALSRTRRYPGLFENLATETFGPLGAAIALSAVGSGGGSVSTVIPSMSFDYAD